MEQADGLKEATLGKLRGNSTQAVVSPTIVSSRKSLILTQEIPSLSQSTAL